MQEWKDPGFRLAYDDAVGDLACIARGKKDKQIHRISALNDVVDYYTFVKFDIVWAGSCLYLSQPLYAFNKQQNKTAWRKQNLKKVWLTCQRHASMNLARQPEYRWDEQYQRAATRKEFIKNHGGSQGWGGAEPSYNDARYGRMLEAPGARAE